LEQDKSNPVKAKLFNHLPFRHYNKWADEKIYQLFVSDTIGNYYRLTDGKHNAPTATLGGYTDYTFSNDGSEICFVMNTDSNLAVSINNDLFITPVEGGKATMLTENKGQDHTPLYSPDGKYISYLSQARAGYESDQNELILYNRKTGDKENITNNFDRSIGYYLWSPDSRYIYFNAIEYGFYKVYRINILNKNIEKLLDDAVYHLHSISSDGRYLAVTRSLSHQPYELYIFDISSKELERLTYFTEDIVKDLDMKPAENFWFEGFNGDSIHGFITYPPDFNPDNKYPLVLLIHGGPQWCWIGDFNYYGWNTQLTSAQDYIVVQIDPHGSIGYGLKFKEHVSGNWGRGDYEDLMLGVDYLLEKHPFIDSTRMAALGRSYGGFMVNWICGHTDRFKCLISIDGSFNQFSDFYTTDELWFPIWEFKGTPVTNPEEYRRASPLTYVENFKTPTMIIHGQRDYRVDVSEAFQMFTALQTMGVPSQFLYFPDEGHSIRKLENLRHVYEKQFEWLAKWLKLNK
jgi:dipeptidyl aminopeptidase/acylaminoacyl peptidase